MLADRRLADPSNNDFSHDSSRFMIASPIPSFPVIYFIASLPRKRA